MKRTLLLLTALLTCLLATPIFADGLQDNIPEKVRPVPPVGIEIPAADRQAIDERLTGLDKSIEQLRDSKDERVLALVPDVEVFARAVRQGIEFRELFKPEQLDSARKLLDEGESRAASLLKGEAPWTTQMGLVIRGFRSKIDRTVQPYGLVIPASYTFTGQDKSRLDIWLHGRGETSSETVFIAERMEKPGQIAPRDTIVLHPYGRYSNAFKFAGEVDVLEALEHVRRHYRIDDNRVAIRGFSMGGAGCWQLAVHYPDLFFAANPGAGFSETPEFLKHFQKETLSPTWYEKKLWQMYDCPGYADNLYQLPTVAYSGELDIQKQAADVMEKTLAERGLRLMHIIGPQTQHSILPESLRIMEQKLADIASVGRVRVPQDLRFATFTLKYNRSHWLTVTGLKQHWQEAKVHGQILADVANDTSGEDAVLLDVANVTALRLAIPAGFSPFEPDGPVAVRVRRLPANASSETDYQTIEAPGPATDKSWECELHLDGNDWKLGPSPADGLRKRHNLQGPIDDAFMDSFILVRPSGKARHKAVGDWAQAELEHAVREWRRQFRGDAIVKLDTEITAEDIAANHLILFGDPESNAVLKSIADLLPIQWTADEVVAGKRKFDAAHHAPVLIYPNPANPQRYVVLNSGFTYREYAYLNNARQVPKLPDWAIVDVRTPPDSLWPGKIVDAQFFDEAWKLKMRGE